MSAHNPKLPRLHFVLVFMVLLSTAAGNTALQSILPVIGRKIHIPDMGVAIIFSLSALFWTFSAPYWAHKSDISGRRLLMQQGMIGFAVSMFLCAIIILLGLKYVIGPMATLVLFTLARSLFGIFGSASNPAAQAYVAARTSVLERTAALALLASAFGLGTIIGPAVAPVLVFPWVGLSGPLFAFTAIAVAVTAWLQFGLPDDRPEEQLAGRGAAASMPTIGGLSTGSSVRAASEALARGRREKMKITDPRIWPFVIFGFASGSMQAATTQAIGFLIIDKAAPGSSFPAEQLIAIAFMAGAGATLLVQWGIIRILDLTPPQLMLWGCVCGAIGLVGVAVAPNFYVIVLAFALSSAGFGFTRPGFTAGSSLAVGAEEQGGVAGAVTSVNGACYVLSPAIGIGLYQLHPELPYWLAALGLVALALYSARNRQLRTVDGDSAAAGDAAR